MDFITSVKRPRILCLHGMRTSGLILSRQMASFKYYVHADFVFIDAPFPASGPPQQVVTQFYPGLPYFEWQPKPYFEWQFQMPDEGLNWLLSYLADKENGSFDGILGFSQGARMAAAVAMAVNNSCREFSSITPSQLEAINALHSFKCLIFIGGVSPVREAPTDFVPISAISSLHIMGTEDPYINQSRLLASLFASETSTVLTHEGGHNIPSLRTGLYPLVDAWIQSSLLESAASDPPARPSS